MRRLGTAALCGIIGACSLFSSYGELDGDGPPPSEAGVEDAPRSDRDATDGSISDDVNVTSDGGFDGDAIDAGSQLVVNGGFENDGCAQFMYNATKATIGASMVAHSGVASCFVCNTGAAMGLAGIWQDYAQGALGPGKYTFEAWARTDGDAGNSLAQAQVTVKTNTFAARYPSFQTTTSTAGWAHLVLTIDVAADEFIAGFLVGLYSESTGPCVVFDDVSLVKN